MFILWRCQWLFYPFVSSIKYIDWLISVQYAFIDFYVTVTSSWWTKIRNWSSKLLLILKFWEYFRRGDPSVHAERVLNAFICCRVKHRDTEFYQKRQSLEDELHSRRHVEATYKENASAVQWMIKEDRWATLHEIVNTLVVSLAT